MTAQSGPVLALDYGTRRIGLAVSDAERAFAFPAGVLHRRSPEADLAALRALVAERGVERIVVGLPIHMNGREGPEAREARAFARRVEEATGLPVEMLDERWTTREAERALEGERRGRRRKAPLDALAATILLRAWLAGAQRGGR